jgi:hypothetical protein
VRSIFISYRRNDSEGEAGRLFDDLVNQFGEASVFMDVAAIDIGRDFRKAIDESVATCAVVLTIIGRNWLDEKNQLGQRRLDDPNDFVRLETGSALKRDIPVIPVLVQGATMPRPEQLPEDLRELAYRNGVELTHARWSSDLQILIKGLRPYTEGLAKAGDTVLRPAPESLARVSQSDEGALSPNNAAIPQVPRWKSRPAVFGALLAIVAAVVAAYIFWPTQTTVPYLIGDTLADAISKLEAAHLTAGEMTRRKSKKQPDTVVNQSPPPHSRVKNGMPVDLVLAQQPPLTTEEPGTPAPTIPKKALEAEKARTGTVSQSGGGAAAPERLPPAQGSPRSVSVTISRATCSFVGPGTFRIEAAGTVSVPAGETYLFYTEASGPGGGTRWRPSCQSWSAADASDGGLWKASCVHRPSDPTETTWQTTTTVRRQEGELLTTVYAGTMAGSKKTGGAERSVTCAP